MAVEEIVKRCQLSQVKFPNIGKIRPFSENEYCVTIKSKIQQQLTVKISDNFRAKNALNRGPRKITKN